MTALNCPKNEMRSHVAFEQKAGKFPACGTSFRSINDKTGCHHPPPTPAFLSSILPEVSVEHPCYPWSRPWGHLRPSWAAELPPCKVLPFQILITSLALCISSAQRHFSDLYIWNIAHGDSIVSTASGE